MLRQDYGFVLYAGHVTTWASESMPKEAERHMHVFDLLIFRETGYTCYKCYEQDAEKLRRDNRLKAYLRTG